MRGRTHSIGAAAVAATLACVLAGSCADRAIIDCAGPGVNLDLRDLGPRVARSAVVTGCADGKCVTYRPGPSGATASSYLFLPLRAFGVTPETISVNITENGRTTFSAATHEHFSVHHGGSCSNGVYFVRVESSGRFHPSGP